MIGAENFTGYWIKEGKCKMNRNHGTSQYGILLISKIR